LARSSAARKPKSESILIPEIEIIGKVARKRFWNQENGRCILMVEVDSGTGDPNSVDEQMSFLGAMPSVREGDLYKFKGNFKNDPKWGRQFHFTAAEIIMPTGTAGVAKYMSNITAGVGVAKSKKIVDVLGEDCIDKIRTNPEVLQQLDFLTETQRREIAEDLSKNAVQAELAGMICREGIGPGMVARIYNKFGADSVQVVKENPYVLADELWGVGFKKADVVAQTVGIAPNSPYRVEAAYNYVINEAGSDGHVFLTPNVILKKLIDKKGLIEASGVELPDIIKANNKLIADGKCVREGNAIYARGLYLAECMVAKAIKRMIGKDVPEIAGINAMIANIESRDNVLYAPEQRQAIKISLQKGLSIVTGGPGTGKSTTLNAVVDIYQTLYPHNEIYLAAPTGRAAKRMGEVTGRPAKTIHRLLGYSPAEGGFTFGWNNPLPGPGLLIVDESSMIDIELMASLLAAVVDLQVILVGDIDQLPSVGPGSVLRDSISSGMVPTVRLKFNYRQAGGSKIAEYANMICRGGVPPLVSAGDFEYIPVEDAGRIPEIVLGLVRRMHEAGYGVMDYSVLAPMRKGTAGVFALNDAVRELVNPARPGEVTMGQYRIRDKVMVIRNCYPLGVFNGDVGQIVNIERGIMTIDFGDGSGSGDRVLVDFKPENLEILTLAYASTIHKSQGSEYPVVIMPLCKQHFIMLQRNLIYTGITRARKKLILIADEWSVKKAVGNNEIEQRFSLLADRIKQN
jgi:exodeoxyribonuclease V alpha subunit